MAGALPRDLGAEPGHGPERPQTVLALEQALDLGHPGGQGAQERGAMRDRLVPGHGQPALEPRHRSHQGVHPSFSATGS